MEPQNSQQKRFYEFGPFTLDTEQRVLLRDGQPLDLPPKLFDTLLALIEQSGQIVEKTELMEKVWPDSFVEESNLASNVSLLRKALGDGEDGTPYIQTVPKRGYRFVATVNERLADDVDLLVHRRTRARFITREEEEAEAISAPGPGVPLLGTGSNEALEVLARPAGGRKRFTIVRVALVLLVASGIAFGLYELIRYRSIVKRLSGAFVNTRIAKLTTNGKVGIAAISPDGKYVAHSMGPPGQQGLWLEHIATGSDTQIVPTAEVDYLAVAFSPDGDYIYFSRAGTQETGIYRVPIIGGPLQKLGRDVALGVAFSRDGKQMAYMRSQVAEVELLIASADGVGQRVLVARKELELLPATGTRTWGPTWSPDGEMIAFALRTVKEDGNYWDVTTIGVKDHAEKQLTSQRWAALDQVAWLADGTGMIVAAADKESYPARQLWYVSYPNGEARKITNDTNDYNGVSLAADSKALVTAQAEQVSNIWLVPNAAEPSHATQITSDNSDGVYGVTWTPDGRVVYEANTKGVFQIWIMKADGTDKRQLTLDASNKIRPAVSRDGRYLVFISRRSGVHCVWRMDLDGGNLKQLSNGVDALDPDITPDSQWVVYTDTDSGKRKLWKVSIDGGAPVRLTDYPSLALTISPDGKQIALVFLDERANPPGRRLGIIPLDGGQPTRTYDIDPSVTRSIHWTFDGRALTYLETHNGVSNVWSRPVDGGQPQQLTDFKSDQIHDYAWSRDGKQLVLARGTAISDVVLIGSK